MRQGRTAKLKIDGAGTRGNFWSSFKVDFPESMGGYTFADTPEDPVILALSRVTVEPGLPSREQALGGKRALVTLIVEEKERSIRELLAKALAGTSFNPATGIEAARQPWGRIAIANPDSGSYANCAIDQAARAVRDLPGTPDGAPDYARFPGPPLDKLGL